MKVLPQQVVASPFMGNYFCLIDHPSMAFVAIAKNGMTFLKNVAINAREGIVPKDEDSTHRIIGRSPESGYLVPISKIASLEKKTDKPLTFAVWRDPVDRLISCYKFFCLEREYRYYWAYLDLYHDNSFERFMEFVEFELKKSHPLYQDEHIRRQADYYKPADVDYIVPMEKLNIFLKEQGVVLTEKKSNSTSVPFQFPDETWREKIKDLYRRDYEIKPNY